MTIIKAAHQLSISVTQNKSQVKLPSCTVTCHQYEFLAKDAELD